MKHIVKLDQNKYIHLDSYGDPPKFLENTFVAIFAIAIASLTAGALFGIDISRPNPASTSTQQLKWLQDYVNTKKFSTNELLT